MNRGITFAGNILVDHNREVDCYPEHSKLVTINKTYNTLGGSVCNSGICISKLDPNLRVNALGLVGNDSDGKLILNELQNYPNLDHSQVLVSDYITSFTDVIADMTNNTRTFFSYKGASSKLSLEHFDFEQISTDFLHVGYILLLDALDQKDIKFGTTLARILSQAQQLGIKTSIDVVTENSDRFQKIVPLAIRYTNYCIINEEEAARTVGIPVRRDDHTLDVKACHQVCESLFSLGVKDWVVIHSREGGIGLDKDGNFVVEAALDIPSEAIKGTTGAGDAFLSGVLLGAYKGYSIEKAVKLGIATSNASLLESGPTAGIKTEKEMWNFYYSSKKEIWPGFDK